MAGPELPWCDDGVSIGDGEKVRIAGNKVVGARRACQKPLALHTGSGRLSGSANDPGSGITASGTGKEMIRWLSKEHQRVALPTVPMISVFNVCSRASSVPISQPLLVLKWASDFTSSLLWLGANLMVTRTL